jgi:hypothetical protein
MTSLLRPAAVTDASTATDAVVSLDAADSPGVALRDDGVHASSGDPLGGRLRELAAVLDGRDRMMGRAARLLVQVTHADGLHDRLGGMTLQVWLEHVCRLPGTDARALLGVVDVLARMPTVLDALADGWLSWRQVAAIGRAARRVRVGKLADLDRFVGDAMVELGGFEPDAVVDDVWQWVDDRQPSRLEREERARDRGEFVHLQPRLTGGGAMYADLGPTSFGTVAEALATDAPPPSPPPVTGPDTLDDQELDGQYATLDDHARRHTRDHGGAMAARLVELCARDLAGSRGNEASDGDPRPARPLLLATVDLDALLDSTRTPGWLLHTLAGGRMKVSVSTVQRLVDERGADLRGVVLDDCGQVVGVGRRTHVPPGWLRQAIWARDLAVRDPAGVTPVRRADLDHVTEWPDGATDVTNLHPVGRRWHNHKTSRTWTVTRGADGTTTWRHRRHGWVLRLAPPRRPTARPARDGPRAGSTDPPGRTRSRRPAIDPAVQPRLAGCP